MLFQEVRLTDLQIATVYTLTAFLSSPLGSGPEGNPLLGRTLSEGVSTPPRQLTATSSSSTSLLVSWELPASPNGNPSYIVTYRRANSDEEYEMISVEDQSTTITDLEVFTMYDIAVSANTSCGESEPVNATAVTGQAPPSAPLNLRVVIALPTALVLVWSPPDQPNGAPLDYTVGQTYIYLLVYVIIILEARIKNIFLLKTKNTFVSCFKMCV